MILRAPFPYFGGKARVASDVWSRFGDVSNYCEPFFGSGAVLLNRPPSARDHTTETVNDLDGFGQADNARSLANWRNYDNRNQT